MEPGKKRNYLEKGIGNLRPGLVRPGGGTAPPRWIPATGLGSVAGHGLVAGFLTAMPRLPDRELAAHVAPLLPLENGSASVSDGLLLLRQVHSADILDAATAEEGGPGDAGGSAGNGYDAAGQSAHTGDGAAALAQAPRWLGVKTADCVPLLAVADGGRAYAALHVGWRGAAAGIVGRLLERWRGRGFAPGSVRLELGPHIGACCYEVGRDCLDAFESGHLAGAVHTPGDAAPGANPHLGLAAVIRNQARALGVPEAHIHVHDRCTRCHDPAGDGLRFASYRRSVARGEPLGDTNLAVIGPR